MKLPICLDHRRRFACQRAGHRRAVAAVEFACVLPFLAAAVLGMVEITRALQTRQYLSDAVRNGARLAAQAGVTKATVTSRITTDLGNNGLNTTNLTVTTKVNGTTADCSTAVQNDQVTVTATLPASNVSWVGSIFVGKNTNLSETLIIMRLQ